MTDPSGTLERLRDRVRTFVELSRRVQEACGASKAGGIADERNGETARTARELESASRELLDRLSRLQGRSRLRVMLGLVATRKRQRRVASLARRVAESLSRVGGQV